MNNMCTYVHHEFPHQLSSESELQRGSVVTIGTLRVERPELAGALKRVHVHTFRAAFFARNRCMGNVSRNRTGQVNDGECETLDWCHATTCAHNNDKIVEMILPV